MAVPTLMAICDNCADMCLHSGLCRQVLVGSVFSFAIVSPYLGPYQWQAQPYIDCRLLGGPSAKQIFCFYYRRGLFCTNVIVVKYACFLYSYHCGCNTIAKH